MRRQSGRAAKRIVVAVVAGVLCAAAGAPAGEAEDILKATGTTGGLIVHVGCGNHKLTMALRAGEGTVVHGLDVDPAKVARARAAISEAGLAGAVAVDTFDGKGLPYVDNLVNLVVAEDLGDVPPAEAMRVLAPRGVAYVKTGGGWRKTVKPVPGDIDDWPHYLHGADNNAVARDTVVGPPKRMQWVGGPQFARSHEINSSMAALVSGGGRLVYIWDENPTGMTDRRFPPNWQLIARDAFNGVVLWKRPMPQWGWRQWHPAGRWNDERERAKMLRHLPPTIPHRLVAAPSTPSTGSGQVDRVYVTLGYQAPVSVLDAATGKVLRELKDTAGTDTILLSDGALVLRVRTADSPPEKDVWGTMPDRARARVVVIDVRTGKTRWQSKPVAMAPMTLAVRAGRVVYWNYDRIICLDLKDGRTLWQSEPIAGGIGHRGTVGTLVAQDKVVLFKPYSAKGKKDSGRLVAVSAETGKHLWRGPKYTGPGITNPPDLFVADGLVWTGETALPVSWSQTTLKRQGLDPLTGKVVREIVVPKLISWGHHYRCYRSKATERFLMLPKRGVEFVDLRGDEHMRHDWLRAPCIYGVLPANGLLYVAPHQCVCYQGALMSNFNAMAPKRRLKGEQRVKVEGSRLKERQRLSKGPAYGKVSSLKSQISNPQSNDWPTYRRDPRRSGSSPTAVTGRLAETWQAQLRAPLTPPVAAGGKVLVAEIDAHTVCALDAETGKRVWQFTAGGRVDSPPTVHGDLVLFGSADGRVYCLRLTDGREVWRFLAAPQDRRVTAFGQVESAWPVHGSVLVQRDATVKPPRPVAYVTAGRSSFLDGGIRLYGLDPRTGTVLHQARLDGPHPDVTKDKGGAGYIDGAKSDLLTGDGADIYLFQERFGSDLTRYPAPLQNWGKEGGGHRVWPAAPKRGSSGKHLITTHGYLSDADNEGKYWTWGNRWPGWDRHMRKVGAYGQLLVVDKRGLYGVHVFVDRVRVRLGRTLGGKGQRLFARNHGQAKDRWSLFVPVRVRAMVQAGRTLYIAGPPDIVPPKDPLAAIEGRRGAALWAVSTANGEKLSELKLDAVPVFDGMIAANGRLIVCTQNGRVTCLGGR